MSDWLEILGAGLIGAGVVGLYAQHVITKKNDIITRLQTQKDSYKAKNDTQHKHIASLLNTLQEQRAENRKYLDLVQRANNNATYANKTINELQKQILAFEDSFKNVNKFADKATSYTKQMLASGSVMKEIDDKNLNNIIDQYSNLTEFIINIDTITDITKLESYKKNVLMTAYETTKKLTELDFVNTPLRGKLGIQLYRIREVLGNKNLN